MRGLRCLLFVEMADGESKFWDRRSVKGLRYLLCGHPYSAVFFSHLTRTLRAIPLRPDATGDDPSIYSLAFSWSLPWPPPSWTSSNYAYIFKHQRSIIPIIRCQSTKGLRCPLLAHKQIHYIEISVEVSEAFAAYCPAPRNARWAVEAQVVFAVHYSDSTTEPLFILCMSKYQRPSLPIV